MLQELKEIITASPGPGRLLLHLEKAKEYCVILEPGKLTVGANWTFMERAELWVGHGMIQVLD